MNSIRIYGHSVMFAILHADCIKFFFFSTIEWGDVKRIMQHVSPFYYCWLRLVTEVFIV